MKESKVLHTKRSQEKKSGNLSDEINLLKHCYLYLGSGLVLPIAVGSCAGVLVTMFLLLLLLQCRRARDKPQPPPDQGMLSMLNNST